MNDIQTVLVTPPADLASWGRAHETKAFAEYLQDVKRSPKLLRTAHEYLNDMVLSYGVEAREELGEDLTIYKFFEHDSFGEDAVFGLERSKMRLMRCLGAAAGELGPEHRILLMVGPVGSSKSTLARLLKRGLERYSATPDGEVYSFSWGEDPCPLNEQPFKLIPLASRENVLCQLGIDPGAVTVEGELCPFCADRFEEAIASRNGDWAQALEEVVRVRRILFHEGRRTGIGTFQPKDNKDQDITELTGDVNYRKLAELGIDSSPKAFSFDGEFMRANRGLLELVELLKCEITFLYEFLGAAQEHTVKPKKFAQTSIDEVLLGHSNRPELDKLMKNEFMEAFRDRTIRIDIPYIVKLKEEVRIYHKSLKSSSRLQKHLSPHTVEMAAMWVILTRLEKSKQDLSSMQKLKLYNGEAIQGWTEAKIKDLMHEYPEEGMDGISPRYIQDKISNALINATLDMAVDPAYPGGCVNPFLVMNEIEAGLVYSTLITSHEKREHYKALLAEVKSEYERIVKDEVRRAVSADEEALERLCGNYVENIKAYTQKEKIKNKMTGQDQEPDERLMRSIEEKLEIPENRKEDFRREIMNYIGAMAIDGKQFTWKSNDRLLKALELKLFEDQKDTMKLVTSGVLATSASKEQLEKIDLVKNRLIKDFGYCTVCAGDILSYVSGIFARGDAAQEVK